MTIEQLITGYFQDAKKLREWTEEDGIRRRDFSARCPAHDDRHKSLRILVKTCDSDDQVIGIRYQCQAGCSPESIIRMAGISEWPEEREELPAVREETALIQETGKNIQELLAGMRAMGEMMRVMNERMTAMEQTIRTLEKVTPGQAAEVNRKIRERAGEICREYGMEKVGSVTIDHRADGKMGLIEKQEIRTPDPERLKELTGAIRRDVREMTGVKTAREIARCDYPAVKEFVESWEDYDVIRRIREKEREAAWKK